MVNHGVQNTSARLLDLCVHLSHTLLSPHHEETRAEGYSAAFLRVGTRAYALRENFATCR